MYDSKIFKKKVALDLLNEKVGATSSLPKMCQSTDLSDKNDVGPQISNFVPYQATSN